MVIALIGLIVLAVGVAALALRSLDRPWLKKRLEAIVSAKAGMPARWSTTQVGVLSGLRLENLQVGELLKIGSLELGWTTGTLLGSGPPLTFLRARDVKIIVVQTADGHSSLDAIGSKEQKQSNAPPTPLSHLLKDLLSASPLFQRADVDAVSLDLTLPKARYRAEGLGLSAAYEKDAGGWRVGAKLGGEIGVEREPAGRGRGKLTATVELTTHAAKLALDAQVLEQTLGPKVKDLIHLEGEARFDPKTKRVAMEVRQSRVADGAATIDAAIELPDEGPPLVTHAEGQLDAVRVLELVPAGLIPLTVSKTDFGYRIENLLLAREPKILPAGGVTLVGELGSAKMDPIAGSRVSLVVDAKPDKEGGARLHASLRFGSFNLDGKTRVAAREGELTIAGRELHLNRDAPRGQVTLGGGAAGVAVDQKKTHLAVKDAKWTASARLTGQPPYNLEADVTAGDLRLAEVARVLAEGPAHVTVHANEVAPDFSRMKGKLDVSLGPVTLALDADKRADVVDYRLTAATTTLAPLRPFLAAYQAPWDRTGVQISSSGKIGLTGHIIHKTTISADKVSFGDNTIEKLVVNAATSGNARKHSGQLDLELAKSAIGNAQIGIGFAFDLAAPSAQLKLTTQGGVGGELKADLAFDRAKKIVRYDVDGQMKSLAALAPWLSQSGLDASKLQVGLTGKGSVLGLVQEVDADGKPRLVSEPLRTLAIEGPVELRLANVNWQKGDREMAVPKALWRLDFTLDGDKRSLHSHVLLDSLRYAFGDEEINIAGIQDELDTSIAGDLRLGVGSVDHRLSVKALEQRMISGYDFGDLTLDVHARRDRDGVVHVSEMRLDNRAAGTAIVLKGGFDVGGERRSMALEGEIKQDLKKLWNEPKELSGRGLASLQLRLTTGNFRLFHALGALQVNGADVKMAHKGYSIESMDGEIPLTADFVFDKKGLRLWRDTAMNAYSELRFSDQHPLLKRQSFITVARVATPLFTVAPLAGNLRIENNVLSLSQFETGLRGGRVTGQCIVDARKSDTNVHMHLRASSVQSTHGEPFDGNAAVVLSMKDRSLEGRAEILRIGRRHLLDLLDVQDPHHGDPAVNRIRKALALGYPDKVRLAFNHGFANVKVTFGGLAQLIRIDELRGIPTGPLIDKLLAPLNAREEESE
jgi:hypothetical protein